jgi:ATP-dependent Clp protease ATP-binding subunit ClpA
MEIASYSSDSRAVIKNAREVAAEFRHPEIEVEHLLIAVIRHEGSEVESILNQLGKSRAFIESMVEDHLKEQSSRSSARESLSIAPSVQEVLTQAMEEKAKLYDPLVEPEHIFIAIFDPKIKLSPYVRDKIDITKEDCYKAIADSKSVAEITTAAPAAEEGKPAGEAGREVAGTLRYCVDLTNQAAAGEFDPMIGREKELQQVIQILLRRRKNSPVLVGGAGVGKSAIVEGFAQAVIGDGVPKALDGVKVMQVEMGSLVAGAKYKVHTITAAGGGGGGIDAANLIKPALARGQIRLVGATTEEEYTKHLEKDKALDRRFEKVKVEEPNEEEAVRIVRGVLSKYEEHHKIAYTSEAVVGAVKYARRYLSERNLPDVALDIVDEAGSEFSVKEEFARNAIPQLTEQISEIEKLMKACEGKDQRKDAEEFEKLQAAYDDFSRGLDRLHGFWGHRLEVAAGEVK